MNNVPILSLPLLRPQALWIAQAIQTELPTLGTPQEPYYELEQRVASRFRNQFPGMEWHPTYFQTCWDKRVKILKEFKQFPEAISPHGQINFQILIKNVLAVNPILSDAEAPDPYDDDFKRGKIDRNRRHFCQKICELAAFVDGNQLNAEEVDREIASIQRHLLHSSLAITPLHADSLEQLFDYLFLIKNIEGLSVPERCNILIESAMDFYDDNTPNDALFVQIMTKAAAIREPKPNEHWSGLQGTEPFVWTLATLAAKTERDLQRLVEFTERALQLGRCLLTELSQEELLNADPESDEEEFVALLREKQFSDEEIYRLYGLIPPAVLQGSLYSELRNMIAVHSAVANSAFAVSPRIDALIQFWLEKTMVEHPECNCHELAQLIQPALFNLLDSIRNHPLFSPENESLLVARAHHYALKNNLSWREIIVNTPSPSTFKECFPLVDPDTTLFKIAKSFFKKHLRAHPLLNVEKIFQEMVAHVLSLFPHMKNEESILKHWASRHLKMLWYMPQLIHGSPFRCVPSVQLFLQWEAVRILEDAPDISSKELFLRLKNLAADQLPHLPIGEIDIEQATLFLRNHFLRKMTSEEKSSN